MALKGFLGSENYTVVIVDEYDPIKRMCSFTARTYTDDSKQDVLTEAQYMISLDPADRVVLSKDVETVPGDAAEGDAYIVGADAGVPWHGMAGCVATKLASGEWKLEAVKDGAMCYVADEATYYVMKDGAWAVATDEMTPESWDSTFAPVSLEVAGNSLMKQLYIYLKAKPEFENAIDA